MPFVYSYSRPGGERVAGPYIVDVEQCSSLHTDELMGVSSLYRIVCDFRGLGMLYFYEREKVMEVASDGEVDDTLIPTPIAVTLLPTNPHLTISKEVKDDTGPSTLTIRYHPNNRIYAWQDGKTTDFYIPRGLRHDN